MSIIDGRYHTALVLNSTSLVMNASLKKGNLEICKNTFRQNTCDNVPWLRMIKYHNKVGQIYFTHNTRILLKTNLFFFFFRDTVLKRVNDLLAVRVWCFVYCRIGGWLVALVGNQATLNMCFPQTSISQLGAEAKMYNYTYFLLFSIYSQRHNFIIHFQSLHLLFFTSSYGRQD